MSQILPGQLRYPSRQKIKELVSTIENRPAHCSGFTIHPLSHRAPVNGLHYDGRRRKPLTKICMHQQSCQNYSEIGYLLIVAFVKGCITENMWSYIYPCQYQAPYKGYPDFARRLNLSCPGYSIVKGPVCGETMDTLEVGRDVNILTMAPYTKACKHSPCDPSAPYLYALTRLFATGLLEDLGLIFQGEPLKGIHSHSKRK